MASMVNDYERNPGNAVPPKDLGGGIVEKRFKKPREGFRAVFVSEDPFWLSGMEGGDPRVEKVGRWHVSKPKSLKEVPAAVLDRIKGIEFKKSDESIRRHMIFL